MFLFFFILAASSLLEVSRSRDPISGEYSFSVFTDSNPSFPNLRLYFISTFGFYKPYPSFDSDLPLENKMVNTGSQVCAANEPPAGCGVGRGGRRGGHCGPLPARTMLHVLHPQKENGGLCDQEAFDGPWFGEWSSSL